MKLTREHIPVGRDNAVTRQRLCDITGLNDREVRRQISELRAKDDDSNLVIVSVSNGRGYFRSNNPDDIRHFIAEMQKRNRMVYQAIKIAKRTLKRIENHKTYGEGLVR
jgi:chromosome segregation and condensation protein ScpB